MIDIRVMPNSGLMVIDGADIFAIKAPLWSIFKYKQLRKRALIMGFIGARGSGKSVGATRTAIFDYMMAGKEVWSNMPIAFRLIKDGHARVFRSNSLDRLDLVALDRVFQNGLLLIDEINMEFAEARRSMSHKNIMFSYILQQLRKRKLNLIWTAQSEGHVEDRLRWQTDFMIKCRDASLVQGQHNCGEGEMSQWTVFDTTGMVVGENPRGMEDMIIDRATILNKPWWNAFDSFQLQGLEPESRLGPAPGGPGDGIGKAIDVINYAYKNKKTMMSAEDIWQMCGISNNKGEQSSVGKFLAQLGATRTRRGKRAKSFYAFAEK